MAVPQALSIGEVARRSDDVLSQIRELRRAHDLLDAALQCGCADLESCTAHR